MKKILLVSSQWAPNNLTGLGFASKQHSKYFLENGYELKSVSLNDKSTDFSLGVKSKIYFISNIKTILNKVRSIVKNYGPDFIIVESLQSIISELFLIYSFKNNYKTILISHGISLVPLKLNLKYILKFLINLVYLPLLLYILKKIDVLFTLKKNDYDSRHLDTTLFLIINEKKIIKKFNNFSRFEDLEKISINNKNSDYFLCIGYLNDIKNQKQIIQIAKKNSQLNFRLIYSSCNRNYLLDLNKKILDDKIRNVALINSKDTNIEDEIKNCTAIINTSLTEVQPISILEGFSLGKIYLSNNIKNLFHLKCGINNRNLNQFIFNLNSLNENQNFKKEFNKSVVDYYKNNFSNNTNSKNFNIHEI